MKAAVESYYDDCDLVIKAAAVADYRSAHPAENKIKKNDDVLTLEMAKNPDILYVLASVKPIRSWSVLPLRDECHRIRYQEASEKESRYARCQRRQC
mgnify:CR=1 FL=1